MFYEEKIFSKEECTEILNFKNIYTDFFFRKGEKYIDTENHRIEQLVGMENGKKMGKFFNVWDIPNDENSEWVFNKLITWFSNVSGVKIKENIKRSNCSLHKYSKGDLFMRHIDLVDQFSNRRWNVGIQLNSDYDGGEYICYNENVPHIFSKEEGTALFYKSDVEHEIKEIIKGERWSIVLSIPKEMIIEKRKIF